MRVCPMQAAIEQRDEEAKKKKAIRMNFYLRYFLEGRISIKSTLKRQFYYLFISFTELLHFLSLLSHSTLSNRAARASGIPHSDIR